MQIIKKYKIVIILTLIVIAGIFFFFYRMYQNDMKALEEFVAAYENFDKTISKDAFRELNAKSNFRLSSLIKNEKEVMSEAREIASLASMELENLIAQKQGNDFTSKRKAAYVRFLELGEVKN